MNSRFLDPRLKGLVMGSQEWFEAQQAMIVSKPLIRRCYDLWYRELLRDADSVPASGGAIVELGSGLSYIKRYRPEVITSDIEPGLADLAADGRRLPFRDGSVRALLLTHVFHHIPDVSLFFAEARRVLVPGGVIGMVEVTHTPFARWFFSTVHPEPYNARAARWDFPEGHTMLDSNQALSWIVFERDRARFEERFPDLRVEGSQYLPWFSYLLSGGVNLRTFIPPKLAWAAAAADRLLRPLDALFAIHWHYRIRKAPGGAGGS
jgi:SAM-dependent methyltransferase